jgi:hypothetical protein
MAFRDTQCQALRAPGDGSATRKRSTWHAASGEFTRGSVASRTGVVVKSVPARGPTWGLCLLPRSARLRVPAPIAELTALRSILVRANSSTQSHARTSSGDRKLRATCAGVAWPCRRSLEGRATPKQQPSRYLSPNARRLGHCVSRKRHAAPLTVRRETRCGQ